MLEHNHVVLTQQFLLVRNINKEIGVVRVEIVHRYVTELCGRLKQHPVCHRVL
ncbi:Uncharacterised protein [Enterobacter cloacae]|nr:Uncharacterised protein [Enterobacter cloacae]